MSEGLTLDGLAVALRALRLLTVDFGQLPAPCVDVSTHFPDRLALSFHDDLAGFEAWREALDIAPDAVTHGTQSGGRTHVLKATADYAGAALELTGFADITVPAPVGSAA
ncbi:hypothetical protein [Streptomyces chartreusis]|uniref:hypothetical protein n=1 Tax=Streptomyces chartreusis TaxID=1969 RepID=UPI0038680951|nr:hypothetical protein OG938_28235 [Streptomyces chartreusis]